MQQSISEVDSEQNLKNPNTTNQNQNKNNVSGPGEIGGLNVISSTSDIKVLRRNGAVVPYEKSKINIAMTKAFLAVEGSPSAVSARLREKTEKFTDQVEKVLLRRLPAGGAIHIEEIQDQVELALMRSGEHEVARAYVLYREKRTKDRVEKNLGEKKSKSSEIRISINGNLQPLKVGWLKNIVDNACKKYIKYVDSEKIVETSLKNIYDGVTEEELFKSVIMTAKTFIERDPAYAKVSAQLLIYSIRK